jgi:probable phosphoglycerate mutase
VQRKIVSNLTDGRRGYGLCADGVAACRALDVSALFANSSPVLVFHSPFLRAKQTAEIVFGPYVRDGRALMEESDALGERFFGSMDGLSDDNYERIWKNDGFGLSPAFGEESVLSVRSRIICFLEERVEAVADGKVVVLVSHGDLLQIAQTIFMGIDPHLHHLAVPYLPVCTLRSMHTLQ